MEIFRNPAVLWALLGFLFFVLEFLLPGFIIFFFAIGAWITAILTFFFDISIDNQLIIFAVTTLLTTVLFRKWVKKLLWSKTQSSELIENEFLGKTGKAATKIAPGQNGKVDFKGTTWDARSEDIIETGENVTIVGNESILLIVKSTKIIA